MSTKNSKGFTIIELLIATSVASVMLLAASFAIIQMSRLYYKGNIVSKTQNTTRNVLDSVSRPIQFADSNVIRIADSDPSPIRYVCIGSQRLTYRLGVEQQDDGLSASAGEVDGRARHVAWLDTIDSVCEAADLDNVNPSSTGGGINGTDLIDDAMRLEHLDFKEQPGSSERIWNIRVKVIYADDGDSGDLLETVDVTNPDGTTVTEVRCKGGVVGSQWCAVAEYNTSVYKRL